MKRYTLPLALALTACAGTADKDIALNGYTFTHGGTKEAAMAAVVETLQDENIPIETINDKYGIVNTGLKELPAKKVSQWRGDTTFLTGTDTWPVEISFTVREEAITLKYCQKVDAAFSGGDSCNAWKVETVSQYFADKIIQNANLRNGKQ